MTEEVKDNLWVDVTESLHPSEDNTQQEEQAKEDPKALRHAQQLEGSRKEAERKEAIAIDARSKLAEKDGNELLELNEKDPKLAEKVAQKFGYSSFRDAKKRLEADGIVEKQPDNEDFETKYQRKRAEEKHEEALKKADKLISKSKLDENLQEKAKAYFDKITNGKTLDEESALEFAEMATLYVSKDKVKAEKLEEVKTGLASTGLSSSKKVDTSDDEITVVRNGRLVTLSSNKSN